jgi:flagellar export protein FliJ
MKNNNLEFRLQTVLTVREHQEKQLENELFQINKAIEQESHILSELNDEIETALFEESTIVKARAEELQVGKAFIDILAAKKDDQEHKIIDIENKEKEKRDELVIKRQSKHMLQTLKNSHTEKIRKENDAKLQNVIDDFANRERRKIGE